ncbi:tRNA(Ile)-lysidine synthetase [Moellerella wisconsensis ATCC 35017]|uniref:tRNA(Ile)-lysidine synthase n=2 Tax=Moellerella wisconsensis TaxID=158849 RepID=A0A0N0Z9L9_9GAMM|nr:tRNA(Ile)-lysidine synthetase [Moellerella wisconsensis ATCC 35017]
MNEKNLMSQLSMQIINTVEEKIKHQRHILVGFSGGLDSTVLLHCLYQLREQRYPDLQIRALHIHHGLNPKADYWVQHCEQICLEWKIPFICRRVEVDASKKGEEAAAREARYQAYRAVIYPNEVMVTAQHLDDQAETFMLALKRGSGPAGLSAMPESMPFMTHVDVESGEKINSLLLRPLLTLSRSQLDHYAQQFTLCWIEDDSNQDDRYDRNFLRLHVMPILNQRWPHFASAAARSAALCAEQESLLDELLTSALQEALDYQGGLSIEVLQTCSAEKRNALIRRWFGYHNLTMPGYHQLQRIWQEVALARQDAEPIFQFGSYDIRRYQGYLWLVRRMKSLVNQQFTWDYPAPHILPNSLGCLVVMHGKGQIRPPATGEVVSIRFGLQQTINIVGREHSRHSKKIWQELGVAPWMRARTPLIYYNEQLITAVGCFVTRQGLVDEGKQGIAIHWDRND